MAGPLDFTGQNIEDTYQRIVQVSGSGFCDGTGSAISIGGTQNLQQVTEQGSVTTTPITASIISASGTIHAGLSSGTSNTIVVSDNGELKTDTVDSKIFNNLLVDRLQTISPTTPAARQLAVWADVDTIRGHDGLIATSDGVITATAISASAGANDISYIGLLDVNKLRINGVLIGERVGTETNIGNTADTKTIIQSPKLEVANLNFTGEITGSIDGGTF